MDDDLRYLRIAQLVFCRPLLIAQDAAETIGAFLRARMEGTTPSANRFVGENQFDRNGRWTGVRTIESANATVLTVAGELVNRGAWIGASSGLTSYEGIVEQARQAVATNTDTILLDINSPGGEALGMSDAAREMRNIFAGKRTIAVVNSMAASAAYGLASAADEIVIGESAVAGSIGVVLVHFDRTEQMKERGVKATIIKEGELKDVGSPFRALTKQDLEVLQAHSKSFMDGFVKLVAENRENLSEDDIRGQQAGIFHGADAVTAGLADRVGTFDSVLAELSSAHAARFTSRKGITMSEQPGAPAAETTGISQADHDAAVTSARNEGVAEGAKTERVRFAAIAEQCGAANLGAALDLAIKSPDMSAEDVTAFVTAHVKPEAGAKAPDYLDHKARGNGTTNLQTDPPKMEEKTSGLSASLDKQIARQTAR